MIDAELVRRKVVLIGADLDALRPLSAKSFAEYAESSFDDVLAERYLERMIGRMIDINYHLVTEMGRPPPRDYHESLTQLAKIGVLPAEFAKEIAACAGLRNRIVHEYDEIDPERLFEGLRAAARDVPEYLRRVLEWLSRESST